MIVTRYMGQGMKRDLTLTICKVSKHQFYHRPISEKKTGRPPSTHTQRNGQLVENTEVVALIKKTQGNEDTNYGYHKMTYQLMLSGYVINHKKVYRLMKQAQLLKEKIKTGSEKKYVKYRKVMPERPLHVIEMDIKMVWLVEHRRHAYILNIIDTFSRVVLHWSVGYQMKQEQVKEAWSAVINDYLQPYDLLKEDLHVELRNDNGPQFSAKDVKDFLEENHIKQTFTHPYTPEENGHVESFHNILKRGIGKHPYWSLAELEDRLHEFYHNYNHKRIHASTANLPPQVFWKCWEENLIERIVMEKKKVRFRLNVSYQQLSGFESLQEVLCADLTALEGLEDQNNKSSTKVKKAA